MSKRKTNSAFSLIELITVIAVLTIAGGSIFLFISNVNTSWETIVDDSTMMNSLRRAAHRIEIDMMQCNANMVTITPGTDWDTIDYQVPITIAAGTVIWGANGTAGWTYRYVVENDGSTDNIYRVLLNGGAEQGRQEILHGIAGITNGNKGLEFSLATGSLTTTIQIKRKIGTQSGYLERSLKIKTRMRNTR